MFKFLNVSLTVTFCSLVFALPSNAVAARSIALKEVSRGPGVNSEDALVFKEVLEKALKNSPLFTLKTTVAIDVLVEKLGGCKNDECYYSAAKEVGIELLVIGQLRKKMNDAEITLQVVDTRYGEVLMEISDQLPGDPATAPFSWVAALINQLEPIAEAAEEMEATDQKRSEEAVKATVITDDELSGKLTTDKSPYLLVKTAIVSANQTLEIEKGVKILMGGDYITLIVYGQIIVNGTMEAPVVFKSAKKEAKNWDWDRIYVRGAARSYFKHCIISNSNFGIHVDNGNATLDNVSFVNNSISCVYALQSNVEIKETDIGKGHISGINIDRGSTVAVDSGRITNTARAIICHPFSTLKMSRTHIVDNDYGLIVSGEAKVRLEDIRISKNRVGILSQKEIKSDRLFMVQSNDENVRIVSETEIANFLSRPEKITAVKVRPAPLKDTTGFETGFASLPSRGENLAARLGLLGQVSLGLVYRDVTDLNGDIHDDVAKTDRPHQTTYIPGFRPELQIFMQSKVGDRESNLTLNGFGNYNRGGLTTGEFGLSDYRNVKRLALFNLTTDLPGQQIVVGDFTQNISEISLASRQIRGLKYTKDYAFSQRRTLSAVGLFGQSSVPWAKGLKPDLLDSATTAERQQLMGLAEVKAQVTRDLSLAAHFVYSRHVDNPVFDPVDLDSTDLYGADPKTRALTGGVQAKMSFNNEFSAYVEANVGYADTLSADVDSGNGTNFSYSKDTLIHHPFSATQMAAGIAGLNYSVHGFMGFAEYVRAQNGFFAAGNPIIHPAVGDLQKARFTGGQVYEFNLLGGNFTSMEVSTSFDWEAVDNIETTIGLDSVGTHPIALPADDSVRIPLLDSLDALSTVSYQPTEHKFRGGLEFKIPIAQISIEPKFSYYYERKPLLKLDAASKVLSVPLIGSENQATGTEYLDAEGRFQFGTGLIYTPPLQNDAVSNLRLNLEYSQILVNDMNTGSPDKNHWDKNDGYQLSTKVGVSAKFLKQILSNKLTVSYRIKEKNENDEVRTTFQAQNQFGWKIIPRKLVLSLKGYWIKTITDYQSEKLDSQQNIIPGEFQNVLEVIRVLGGESELKYSLSAAFSLFATGGTEQGLDDAGTGGENFTTYYGGLTLNYLF